MPLKVGVLTCELSTNPSIPNDKPETTISVACFMVDIYPVLVKIVMLTLSSKLKVSRRTFSKSATNITSVVVAQQGTARNREVLQGHHLHQPVTVYLDECSEGDRLQSLFDKDDDSCQA